MATLQWMLLMVRWRPPAMRAAVSNTLLCWAVVLSAVNATLASHHTSTSDTYTNPVQLAPEQRAAMARLIEKALKSGTVNVIIGFKLSIPYTPEGRLVDRAAVERQRAGIAQARNALLSNLQTARATEYARWDTLPLVGLSVDGAALRLLAESSQITTIQEDSVDRSAGPEQRGVVTRLIDKAMQTGTVNVIVGLKLPEPYAPESQLPDSSAVDRQRAAIAQTRNAVLASLSTAKATEYGKWDPLPLMALRVDAAALQLLAGSSLITTIQEDGLSSPQ